jgi:hypothetical protein
VADPYFKADKGGVVKLASATDTSEDKSASSSAAVDGRGGTGSKAGGGSVPGASKDKPAAPPVPPALIAKAKDGDPDALKALEALGIGLGTVGGAYALYRLMKGKGGKTTQGEVIEPDEQGRYMVPREPDVINVQEEVIPRQGPQRYLQGPKGSQVPSGGQARLTGPPPALPAPTAAQPTAAANDSHPYYQQRRDRAAAQAASVEDAKRLQFQDAYAARRAKAAAIARTLGRAVP